MNDEQQNPALCYNSRPKKPTPKQIVELIVYCLPIVTIPFLIFFLFKSSRLNKKTRDVKNVIYLCIAGTASIIASLASRLLYLSSYTMVTLNLGPVPVEPWAQLHIDQSFQVFAWMEILGIIFAIAINRLSCNLLMHEEQQFRPRAFTFWEKIEFVFKWKNERTALASGNESLMKVKNAATFYLVTTCLVLVTTPVVISLHVNLMDVFQALLTGEAGLKLTAEDKIVAAAYVLIIGVPFVLSNMLLWFYTGRIFSYQAHHNLRRGKYWYLWMKIFAYIISIEPFLLLVLSITAISPSYDFLVAIITTLMAIACWMVIIEQFWRDPANMVLDPKNFLVKLQKGMLSPGRDGFSDPAQKQDFIKKWCHGFLITTIAGMSAINAAIWFPSAAMYSRFTNWYESGFYFGFGLLLTVGPILLLFFLENVYARRLLMGYFIIILLVLAQVLIANVPLYMNYAQFFYAEMFDAQVTYTRYIDIFSTGTRPGNLLLVLLVGIVASIAFFIIKRKALPVPITTRKHPGGWSQWKNLRAFIFSRKASRKSNIATVAFLAMVGGMLVTFQPPPQASTIILSRPAHHEMQVSFWASGFNLQNNTLAILHQYHIRLYGWFNYYDIAGANNYADHGIQVVPVIHMPNSTKELKAWLATANSIINYWNFYNLTNHPFIGFAFDWEEMRGIRHYNESAYADMVDAVKKFTTNITAQGLQVFPTVYLVTIGDLLDGDADVSIDNFDPFDPSWNVSHFDWMIYRSELAIGYNEPSAYFTYEWARYIKHYMTTIGSTTLFSKASMSIGVTSNDLPLYQGPDGFGQFLMDAKICHAMEISEIIIFYLGTTKSDYFLGKWGNDGIINLMNELLNYTTVAIPFNRRATFFGNLIGSENPTGSLFGFIYEDCWLNQWVGALPFAWLFCLVYVPFLLAMHNRAGFTRNPPPYPRENPKSTADNMMCLLRLALVVMIFIIIALALIVLINPTFVNGSFYNTLFS